METSRIDPILRIDWFEFVGVQQADVYSLYLLLKGFDDVLKFLSFDVQLFL